MCIDIYKCMLKLFIYNIYKNTFVIYALKQFLYAIYTFSGIHKFQCTVLNACIYIRVHSV